MRILKRHPILKPGTDYVIDSPNHLILATDGILVLY